MKLKAAADIEDAEEEEEEALFYNEPLQHFHQSAPPNSMDTIKGDETGYYGINGAAVLLTEAAATRAYWRNQDLKHHLSVKEEGNTDSLSLASLHYHGYILYYRHQMIIPLQGIYSTTNGQENKDILDTVM